MQQFTKVGIQVNAQKSSTQARQQVIYLGQILDLEKNKVRPHPRKIQGDRKLLTDILAWVKVLLQILAKVLVFSSTWKKASRIFTVCPHN